MFSEKIMYVWGLEIKTASGRTSGKQVSSAVSYTSKVHNVLRKHHNLFGLEYSMRNVYSTTQNLKDAAAYGSQEWQRIELSKMKVELIRFLLLILFFTWKVHYFLRKHHLLFGLEHSIKNGNIYIWKEAVIALAKQHPGHSYSIISSRVSFRKKKILHAQL